MKRINWLFPYFSPRDFLTKIGGKPQPLDKEALHVGMSFTIHRGPWIPNDEQTNIIHRELEDLSGPHTDDVRR